MAQRDDVETWVGSYGQEIHAYLWRMLGDRQDAEDCLQETFVRALRHSGGEAIRSPRAWLYTIATNTARSQLRHKRRERIDRVSLEDENRQAAPEDKLVRERLEAVRHEVEALPPKQRQALLLRRYQGLGYDEIAKVLGGSPQAARANVYQAVRKLKKAFPEESR
jgi:RNA polymerase sigma-70 factor (ECF subfamily)